MQKIEVEIKKKINNQPTVKARAGFGIKFTTDGEETVSLHFMRSVYSIQSFKIINMKYENYCNQQS